MKTVQITVRLPSVLNHPQRGEARRLALEEEVLAVRVPSEEARRV